MEQQTLRIEDLPQNFQAIIAGVVASQTNAQIGEALGFKAHTIATYLQRIFVVTGVRGRVALAQWARGYRDDDDARHCVKTCAGGFVDIPESEIIKALPRVKDKQAILLEGTAIRAKKRERAADRRTAEIRRYEQLQRIHNPDKWRSPSAAVKGESNA